MNRIFKVIFNKTTQQFVVVSELGKSTSRDKSHSIKKTSCLHKVICNIFTLSLAAFTVQNAMADSVAVGANQSVGAGIWNGDAGVVGNASATGDNSSAFGNNSQASGTSSVALGDGATTGPTQTELDKFAKTNMAPIFSYSDPGTGWTYGGYYDGRPYWYKYVVSPLNNEQLQETLNNDKKDYGNFGPDNMLGHQGALDNAPNLPNGEAIPYDDTFSSPPPNANYGYHALAVGPNASAGSRYDIAIGSDANTPWHSDKSSGTTYVFSYWDMDGLGKHLTKKTVKVAGFGERMAIGLGSRANAMRGIAIGTGAETGLQGDRGGSVPVGPNSGFIFGVDSIAIGSFAKSVGHLASVAIGPGAFTNKEASFGMALGTGTRVDPRAGVALGAFSIADRKALPVEWTSNDQGKRPASNVSVLLHGADGKQLDPKEGQVFGTGSRQNMEAIANTAKYTRGAVSVGGEGYSYSDDDLKNPNTNLSWLGTPYGQKHQYTRQITNVAAGSEDSDAVNVAQLKGVLDAIPTYLHVNYADPNQPTGLDPEQGGVTDANKTNFGTGNVRAGAVSNYDVALGVNAITGANAGDAVSIGHDVTASAKKSIAIGKDAVATGKTYYGPTVTSNGGTTTPTLDGSSLAIGDSAHANVSDSIAIGTQAVAGVYGSINNDRTNVNGVQSMAIGSHAQSNANWSVALGAYAKSSGENAVAIGLQAIAEGQDSIAQGNDAETKMHEGIAIGYHARATSDDPQATRGMALGYNAHSNNESAVAIGISSTASGDSSTALGRGARALGDGAIAIGDYTTQEIKRYPNSKDVPETLQTVASGAHSLALGSRSQATVDNGVALGSNSIANRDKGSEGYDISSTKKDGISQESSSAWKATAAAVSVGHDDQLTRQITGVAAGTQDTDAVNVAQLKKIQSQYQADNKKDTISRKPNQVLELKGGATNGVANSIKTIGNTAGSIEFQVSDTLTNMKQITFGNSSTNPQTVSIGQDGINAGDHVISNVASGGKTATNAANIGDVQKAVKPVQDKVNENEKNITKNQTKIAGNTTKIAGNTSSINNINTTIEKGLNFSGDTGTIKTQLGDTVKFIGGADKTKLTTGNIGVNVENGKIHIQLAKDLKGLDSVHITNGPSMDTHGINAGDKAITHVAAPTNGTDAANKNYVDNTIDSKTFGLTADNDKTVTKTLGNAISVKGLHDDTQKQGQAGIGIETATGDNGALTIGLTQATKEAIAEGQKHTQLANGKTTTVSQIKAEGADKGKWQVEVNQETTPLVNDHGHVASLTDENKFVNAKALSTALGNMGFTVKANAETTGEFVKSGGTVTLKAGNNMEVTRDGSSFTFATSKNPKFDSVTVNGENGKNPVVIDKSGINAGDHVISNVASGGKTGTNAANIDDVKNAVKPVKAEADQNKQDIAGNKQSITKNTNDININKNKIAGNTKNIDGNTSSINNINTTIEKGLSFSADSGLVNKKLGQTLHLVGGAEKTNLTTGNIGVNIDEKGNINIQLAKDLHGLNYVHITNGPSMDTHGINAGNKPITNVANPTSSTDATNKNYVDNTIGSKTFGLTADNGQTVKHTLDGAIPVKGLHDTKQGQAGIGIETATGDNGALTIGLTQATKEAIAEGQKHTQLANGETTTVSQIKAEGADKGKWQVEVNKGSIIVDKATGTIMPATTEADANKFVDAKSLSTTLGNMGFTVKTDKSNDQGQMIHSGGTVTLKAGNNMEVTRKNGTFTFATSKTPTFDSVTVNGENGKNPVVIDKSGINAGDHVISNVASGGKTGTNAANIDDVKNAVKPVKAEADKNKLSITKNAGDIKTDKDAIDGNKQNINSVKTTLDQGLNFSGDNKTALNKKLGETVDFVGGAKSADLTEGNIGVNVKDGKIHIQLAKDLKGLDSVKITNGPSMDTTGINAGDKAITHVAAPTNGTDAANKNYVDSTIGSKTFGLSDDKGATVTQHLNSTVAVKGATNGDIETKVEGDALTIGLAQATKEAIAEGQKHTQLANGETTTVSKIETAGKNQGKWKVEVNQETTPLVNDHGHVASLTDENKFVNAKALSTALGNMGFTVKANAETTGEFVKSGGTVTLKAGNNMEVTRDGSSFTFATSKNPKFDSVTVNGENGKNPVVINKSGINAGDQIISNVASGGTTTSNAANIGDVQKAINPVKAEADQNKQDIAGNKQSIVNNAGNIETNKNTITSNQTKIAGNTETIARGLSFSADTGSVNKKLGQTLHLVGGAEKTNLTTGNIGVNIDGKGNVNIQLAKDLHGLNSVHITNGPSMTTAGIDAGNKQITHVASGLGNNQTLANADTVTLEHAANIGDLKNAVNIVKTDMSNQTLGYSANNTTKKAQKTVKLSQGLNFLDGTNTHVTIAEDGKVTYSLNPALTKIKSISGDNAELTLGDDGITVGDKSHAPIAIHGVKAGIANTDAANVGQLTQVQGEPDEVSVSHTKNAAGAEVYTVSIDPKVTQQIKHNGIEAAKHAEVTSPNNTISVVSDTADSKTGGKIYQIEVNKGTISVDNATGTITPATTEADANKFVDAKSLSTVLGNMGFTVKSGDDKANEGQLIHSSDSVTFKSGDNMEVTRDGSSFTFATSKTPTFDNVTIKNKPTNATDATNKAYVDSGRTVVASPNHSLVVNHDKVTHTYNLEVATTSLTLDKNGKVVAPSTQAVNNETAPADKFVTAGDVAKVLNSTGFTLSAQGQNGSLIKAGDTVNLQNTDGNIQIEKNKANGNVTFGLNPQLNGINSISNGNNATKTNGAKITLGTTNKNIDVNNGQISHVKSAIQDQTGKDYLEKLNQAHDNPTMAQDAVNVSDLQQTADALNKTIENSAMQYQGDNTKVTIKRTSSEILSLKGGAATGVDKSIQTQGNADGSITFKVSKNLNGMDTITFEKPENSSKNTPAVSIGKSGINAGDKKITDLASGGDNEHNAANIGDVKRFVAPVQKGVNHNADEITQLGNNTFTLGGDNQSVTTSQHLNKQDGLKFNVIGDKDIVTKASGNEVAISLSTATKALIDNAANKDLSNLTEAGNKVITGLGSIVKTTGIATVTHSTDKTTGRTTYIVDVTADGQVITNDNKAVSGDTVYKALQKNNNTLTSQGFNLSGDNGDVVHKNLGETIKLAGDNNITTKGINKYGEVTITLNKTLTNMTLFQAGNTTVSSQGIQINDGPSVMSSGINAGDKQITQVKSGLSEGESINKATGDTLKHAANIGDVKNAIEPVQTQVTKNSKDIATNRDDINKIGTVKVSGNAGLEIKGNKNLKSGNVTINLDSETLANHLVNTKEAKTALQKGLGDGKDQAGNPGLVNGDTLHKALTKNTDTMTSKGLNFIADNFEAKDDATIVHKDLGSELTIIGGANKANLTANNIGVNVENGEIKVQLAKDLAGLRSVIAGDTTLNGNGVTISGGPSITKAGIDAHNKAITNVSAGKIGTAQAINGQQLAKLGNILGLTPQNTHFEAPIFEALKDEDGKNENPATSFKDAINDLTHSVNKGFIINGNSFGKGTNNGQQYLGSTLHIVGGKTVVSSEEEKSYSADNLTTVYTKDDGNGTITIKMKKDPIFRGVTLKNGKDNGSTVLNPQGITITSKPNGTSTKSVSLTENGLDNGGHVITNVAEGNNDTDAVNLKQLNNTRDELTTKGLHFGADKPAKPNQPTSVANKLGSNVDIKGDSNITTTVAQDTAGNTTIQVNLNPNINVQKGVTVAKTVSITKDGIKIGKKGPSLTTAGLDNAGKIITHVASGLEGQTLENAKGKTLQNAVNVGDLQQAVNDVNTHIEDKVDKVKLRYKANSDSNTQAINLSNESLNFTSGKNLTASVAKNGEVKYELKPELQNIGSISGGENAKLSFGPHQEISVNGGQIKNVAKGNLSADSTDAVNGSQLHDTNEKVQEIDKAVQRNTSQIDENTKRLEKGMIFAGNKGSESQQLGSSLTISGDKKAKDESYSSSNLTTTYQKDEKGNGTVKIEMKDNPEFKGVQLTDDNGDTKVTMHAGTSQAQGEKVPTPSIVLNGGKNQKKPVPVRIENVADGVAPTDAVNVRQVQHLTQNISNGFNQMNDRINEVDKHARAGIATAGAIATLPQEFRAGRSQLAAAATHYRGQSALAIGYSRISDNSKWMIRFTGSTNSQKDTMVGVGAGYSW